MRAREWTEKHQREAIVRSVEIAAMALRGDVLSPRPWSTRETAEYFRAAPVLARGFRAVETEATWREWMRAATTFDQARIDREVRRVRGLAEGRLVREKSVRHVVRYEGVDGPEEVDQGASWDYARGIAKTIRSDDNGARAVRITKTTIQRAP